MTDNYVTSEIACGDKSNLARKLRKKLRQIQMLERLERELTLEEEMKVKYSVLFLNYFNILLSSPFLVLIMFLQYRFWLIHKDQSSLKENFTQSLTKNLVFKCIFVLNLNK